LTKAYLVTKSFEPEGEYRASLAPLSDDNEVDISRDLPGVVIKFRYLEDHEVAEVASRPHVLGVEEDVDDHALGYGGFDDSALAYHEIDKALKVGYGGKGVKVAVLDTGIVGTTAREHFGSRLVASRSFISGEEVEDGNGHGDFCCVAACPQESELIVGKVLSNEGSGSRSGIIAGMNWAVSQGAHILSMSLGGSGASTAYDATIRAAKAQGCVTFAAAGNGGREGEPVNTPGNSPDAYAVAAINHRTGKIADFSCRGPEVDFAAAGSAVMYGGKGWSGTSMATPLAARCYATLRSVYPDWQSAFKGFLTSLEDTPAPVTEDGAGVPKVMKGIVSAPPPKPAPAPAPTPKPEPTKPLPTLGYMRFLTSGVTERTIITRNQKPWVIAEPLPKQEAKGSAHADNVCCRGDSPGCGGSYRPGEEHG
jgi:subtilisin family serine protease